MQKTKQQGQQNGNVIGTSHTRSYRQLAPRNLLGLSATPRPKDNHQCFPRQPPHLCCLLAKGVLVACHLWRQVLVVTLLALKVCLQDRDSLLVQVLVLVLLQQQEKTFKRYGWTGAQYTTQLPITVAAPCPSC